MSGKMYTPFKIKDLEVKNRIVISGMFEWGAVDGVMTDKIRNHYLELAKGGAGMIITGMNAVCRSGLRAPFSVHTEYEGYADDIKGIAEGMHKNGAKYIIQLQHCGGRVYQAEGYDNFSVCEEKAENGYVYHAATKEEIAGAVKAFADSARRAKEAGADGVQIHAGHGFLINSFISPSQNHRTDEYGGCIENRARILFEAYEACRKAVGEDFVIGIKLSFNELREISSTEEEMLIVCKILEKKGLDFIEVSSGMILNNTPASFSPVLETGAEPPFLKYASMVADTVSIPVISVCGFRTPEAIEKALSDTNVTAVSLGRPIIREPDLPNRWKTDGSPARCISCNRCCNSLADGIVTCQTEKELQNR